MSYSTVERKLSASAPWVLLWSLKALIDLRCSLSPRFAFACSSRFSRACQTDARGVGGESGGGEVVTVRVVTVARPTRVVESGEDGKAGRGNEVRVWRVRLCAPVCACVPPCAPVCAHVRLCAPVCARIRLPARNLQGCLPSSCRGTAASRSSQP